MEDMAMNTALDLAPLWRSGIGFDGLIDMLNEARQPVATHPPYNIEKTGENAYRITLAVAGFKPNELSITSEPNLLTIVGQPAGEPNRQFLYQGLQHGASERRAPVGALRAHRLVSKMEVCYGCQRSDSVEPQPLGRRLTSAGRAEPSARAASRDEPAVRQLLPRHGHP